MQIGSWRRKQEDKLCVSGWCLQGLTIHHRHGLYDGWLDGLDGEMERCMDRDRGIRDE